MFRHECFLWDLTFFFSLFRVPKSCVLSATWSHPLQIYGESTCSVHNSLSHLLFFKCFIITKERNHEGAVLFAASMNSPFKFYFTPTVYDWIKLLYIQTWGVRKKAFGFLLLTQNCLLLFNAIRTFECDKGLDVC